MKKLFTLALVILGFSVNSFGQATSTATAITSATIITPLLISKTTDMNFGNVTVSVASGGTVVLPTSGVRTRTGGVTLPALPGTVTAAQFTVTGLGTSAYSIIIPTAAITLTGTPSGTMTVDNFVSSPTANGALVAGSQIINVGATLNVGAAQTAGAYTNPNGLFVTVCYN